LARLVAAAVKEKDTPRQEQLFRRIIDLDPQDPEAHQHLAQILQELGRREEAWAEFELAAALNPEFLLPLFSLADSKSRAGKHDDALQVAQRIPAEGLGPGSR